MERLTPVIRISVGLVVLTCSLLVVVDLAGLLPSPADEALEARIRLCETLAAQATSAGEVGDLAAIRTALQVAAQRDDDLLSAGLRGRSGHLLVAVGEHRELWNPPEGTRSTSTHVRVPLFRSGKEWATLEVRFARLGPKGLLASLWDRPLVRLVALVGGFGFVLYLLYIRKTLRHLDPSAVIPARVQAALDVMVEGVLLIDSEERIVLANAAFGERVGRSSSSLLGLKVSDLGWNIGGSQVQADLPWVEAIRESRTSTGTAIRIERDEGDERILIANGSPILDGWGRPKGAIVTFDDVTELERRTRELKEALAELEKSQDEVRLQNEELQQLAKSDPLTGIANRRSFMSRYEEEFVSARIDGRHFNCIMADIDHFKRINDTHGHSAGDEVIRRVAESFASEVRSTDAVCRYGGEEFCIVLADIPVDAAISVAERLRRKVQAPGFARVPVTVSLGVSTSSFGASQLAEMIDQADQALYAAKEGGRNRVCRFDEVDAASSE